MEEIFFFGLNLKFILGFFVDYRGVLFENRVGKLVK